MSALLAQQQAFGPTQRTPGPIIAPLRYDPWAPQFPQTADWTCSACSLAWALRSIGREVYEWDAVDLMGPDDIDPRWGLSRADMTDMVKVLAEQGITAWRRGEPVRGRGVTFDELARAADGTKPIVLGGFDLVHIMGVRLYDPVADVIRLANSAGNWRGIKQELDREEFAAWGPWSMAVFSTWE